MSKWIETDAFLKEYCEPYPHIYKAMSRAMADAPSIDIVFCKECKHNVGLSNGDGFWEEDIVCDYWESDGLTAYDFCSYGEREGE